MDLITFAGDDGARSLAVQLWELGRVSLGHFSNSKYKNPQRDTGLLSTEISKNSMSQNLGKTVM